MKERWIPKKDLVAQGYFEGATYIWVPKQVHKQSTSYPQVPPTSRRPQCLMKQRWIPKVKMPQTATITKRAARPQPAITTSKPFKRATTMEKGKWIPKQIDTQGESNANK